jgi:hypothetical protein
MRPERPTVAKPEPASALEVVLGKDLAIADCERTSEENFRYASATDTSTPAADDDPRISAPSDTAVSSMSASVIGPAASRNSETHRAATEATRE